MHRAACVQAKTCQDETSYFAALANAAESGGQTATDEHACVTACPESVACQCELGRATDPPARPGK